jgi:hypothetical protein
MGLECARAILIATSTPASSGVNRLFAENRFGCDLWMHVNIPCGHPTRDASRRRLPELRSDPRCASILRITGLVA